MQNDPIRSAAEGMPAPTRSVPKVPDPRLRLSFRRRATKQELELGAMPFVYWSVEPSGNYSADVERGKAIAEEALAFMAEFPTYGKTHLVADMLRDMHRQADETHRGLVLGFGIRLGQFAMLAASIVVIDAVRNAEAAQDQPEGGR